MLRGFRNQRFAGDGVVYGNGELRWFLTEFFLLLPGDLGLFGLGDVGRVFLEEESSSRWHSSVGGGIWISFLDRKNTLSLALARSAEETGIYVKAGFLF
jgi:hemolysin activation/secretion protein